MAEADYLMPLPLVVLPKTSVNCANCGKGLYFVGDRWAHGRIDHNPDRQIRYSTACRFDKEIPVGRVLADPEWPQCRLV